jgi:hypothetical protein
MTGFLTFVKNPVIVSKNDRFMRPLHEYLKIANGKLPIPEAVSETEWSVTIREMRPVALEGFEQMMEFEFGIIAVVLTFSKQSYKDDKPGKAFQYWGFSKLSYITPQNYNGE